MNERANYTHNSRCNGVLSAAQHAKTVKNSPCNDHQTCVSPNSEKIRSRRACSAFGEYSYALFAWQAAYAFLKELAYLHNY